MPYSPHAMPLPWSLITFSCFGTLLKEGNGEFPPFPEVPGALRRLGNRVALGLLEDVAEDRLREIAETKLGFPISLFVGTESTDAATLFRTLLKRCGPPPQRILHVSAFPCWDLPAARSANLATAFLDRGEHPAPEGFSADFVARDLTLLAERILARDDAPCAVRAPQSASFPAGYLEGIRLFNQHRFFEAHEAWEQVWKSVSRERTDFFQGLIQFAAALLQWERGNPRGAGNLYAEARARLARFVPRFLGLDVLGFLERMEEFFEPIQEARRGRKTPAPPRMERLPRLALEEEGPAIQGEAP